MANSFTLTASTLQFSLEIAKALHAIDDFKEKTSRDFSSTKQQMRQTIRATQELNHAYLQLSDGAKNSDFGREMKLQLQEAIDKSGELKDEIADLSQDIGHAASDTRMWDGMAEGLQLCVDAGTSLSGAMGLITGDSEAAARTINLVAAAQGGLNTAIGIMNALNKDSKLMDLVGMIQRVAAAKAAETVATGAATIAQRIFNAVAKANPYVLLASAVLALGGAIFGLVEYFTSATDAEKAHEAELERLKQQAKEVADAFRNTLNTETTNLIGKYWDLQNQWKSLRSTQEKQEFLEDNKQAFKDLGLEIDNTSDAEEVFNSNSAAVIKALNDRAMAAAYAAEKMKLYQQAIEASNLAKKYDQNVRDKLSKKYQEKYGLTKHDADKLAAGAYSTGPGATNARKEAAEKKREGDEMEKQQFSYEQKANKVLRKNGKHGGRGKSSSSTSSSSTSSRSTPKSSTSRTTHKNNTTPKEVIPEDSIKDLQNKISNLKALIEVTTDPHTLFNLLKLIDDYLDKIKAMEIPIKLLEKIDKNGVSALGKLDNGINTNDLKINIPKIKAEALPDDWEEKWNQNVEKWDKEAKIQENIEALEELKGALSGLGGAFGSITTLWVNLAELFTEGGDAATKAGLGLMLASLSLLALGANGAAAKVGAIMAAVGLIVLGFSTVAAQATELGPFGWLAWVGAGLAAVATTISTIKSFNTGGIVEGATTQGDRLLARVNAGEMILNSRQQKNLFNLANSGGALAGSANGNVEFKISGSTLKGVLRNYDSKMNKIK